MEFLQYPLPESMDGQLIAPKLLFSKDPPTFQNLTLVLANNLPDAEHLKELKQAVAQKWMAAIGKAIKQFNVRSKDDELED